MATLLKHVPMIFRRLRSPARQNGRAAQTSREVIGIPRSLHFFLYPGLWKTFFDALEVPSLISAPTNRVTLERAGLVSETEHCLPAKILDAHLDELAGKVPRVFVPRVLSMRRNFIACPKLAALPDAVRAQFGDRVEVLTVELDENKRSLEASLVVLGRQLGFGAGIAGDAARTALQTLQREHRRMLDPPDRTAQRMSAASKRFLLIGHPYNLHDEYLIDPVRRSLADLGATVVPLDHGAMLRDVDSLKWDMCALMFEALRELDPATCAGVIQLTSFNCGCDSMAGLYYRELLKQKGIPYMTLTLDTHTSHTGLETRLEAFVDSIGEHA